MLSGLVGRKLGMSRVFDENGNSTPVTVVEITPNRVTQVKTLETDGYNAVQVTAGEKKQAKLTKPEAGQFAKASVLPGDVLLEFRFVDADNMSDFALGNEFKVADIFKAGQIVDVTGTSKGKGYAGTIKRWNFSGQRNSHGNSLSHRAPGSIGQCQTPGRVFKGKKMSGHLGNEKVTVQNLEVVKVDEQHDVLLIKGAIPGAIGNRVIVRHAVKKLKEVGVA